MKKYLLGGLVAAASLLASAPANAAAMYTSYLEYKDTGGSSPTKSNNPFGKVTLTQVDAHTITVNVILYTPEVAFLNTGGPHDPFLFNLTGDYDVTTQNAMAGGKMQTFKDGGYDADTVNGPNFTATPFGNFTNKISCCTDANGKELNGAANDSYPPLNFTVTDNSAGGITFAGAGALFDSNGKLFQLGTGDRFASNAGGWWFTADLVDNKGNTFNVGARDAFKIKQGAVPEPASWALMITGFGVVGVGMRRSKAAQRQTQAA